ncbi:hypothetical protein B5S33_g2604 [[Candida] boidinii]|nr:hypothetical protein B5S27_g4970 [[Candida] boidinii]OWB68588.1 hypothetical protein B5S30_g3972 [[Candida] boidinii]OWB83968.1 hypothetical protein B5S33_g2604 [[Candida] boidinii]
MLRQTRATMSVIKKEVETGKVSKYFGATRTRSTRASAVVKTEDTDEPEIPLSPQQDPIAAASTRIRRVSGRLQQYQNRDDSIPITSSVKKEELDASIPSSDKKPQAANKKRRLTKVKVEVEVEQQPDAIPARTDHLAAEEPPHVGSLPAVPVPAADLADALVADEGRGELHGDADAGRALQDGHGILRGRPVPGCHAGNRRTHAGHAYLQSWIPQKESQLH